MNSDKLYGGGISELPRIKYIKPADVTIEIASLVYYQKNQLKHIFELNKEEKINLSPINSGFWEFSGKMPQIHTMALMAENLKSINLKHLLVLVISNQ
ncbi:MAG: hypothetical protein IPH36_14800 [Saprospiraceae bacterium]|nr:hypothetical protein [Saprospiraceae bacterium]